MPHILWSVPVCMCVLGTREPCENVWTDRDAVWGADLSGKNHYCSRWVHIDVIWWMRLKDCMAVMWLFCQISLNYFDLTTFYVLVINFMPVLLCVLYIWQILIGFDRGLIVLWNVTQSDVQRAYISLQVCWNEHSWNDVFLNKWNVKLYTCISALTSVTRSVFALAPTANWYSRFNNSF